MSNENFVCLHVFLFSYIVCVSTSLSLSHSPSFTLYPSFLLFPLSPSCNHPFRVTLEGHPPPRTACSRTRPGVAVSSRAASARASLAIVGPRVRKTGEVLVVDRRVRGRSRKPVGRTLSLSRDLVRDREQAPRFSRGRDEAPGCFGSSDDRTNDQPSRSWDSSGSDGDLATLDFSSRLYGWMNEWMNDEWRRVSRDFFFVIKEEYKSLTIDSAVGEAQFLWLCLSLERRIIDRIYRDWDNVDFYIDGSEEWMSGVKIGR